MITLTLVSDTDSTRIYDVKADDGRGRVVLNKHDKSAQYSGKSLWMFPPEWVKQFALGALDHPDAPDKFSYGFG